MEVLIAFIGALCTIIGFFLVKTMNKLDNTHNQTVKNTQDIAVIKVESDLKLQHIGEKIDSVKTSVDDMRHDLKQLLDKK